MWKNWNRAGLLSEGSDWIFCPPRPRKCYCYKGNTLLKTQTGTILHLDFSFPFLCHLLSTRQTRNAAAHQARGEIWFKTLQTQDCCITQCLACDQSSPGSGSRQAWQHGSAKVPVKTRIHVDELHIQTGGDKSNCLFEQFCYIFTSLSLNCTAPKKFLSSIKKPTWGIFC